MRNWLKRLFGIKIEVIPLDKTRWCPLLDRKCIPLKCAGFKRIGVESENEIDVCAFMTFTYLRWWNADN